MKFSELRGEAALDVLAEIIEPAANILADKDIQKMTKSGMPTIMYLKQIIKNHKKDLLCIMAHLEGAPVEEYNPSMLALPKLFIEIMNDAELKDFFSSQAQSLRETASTDATVNTEESEK